MRLMTAESKQPGVGYMRDEHIAHSQGRRVYAGEPCAAGTAVTICKTAPKLVVPATCPIA